MTYNVIYDSRRWIRSDSSDTTVLLPVAAGGSAADLSATGGANQFVKQSTLGGAFTVGAIGAGDVPDAALTSNVALLNRNSQDFTGSPQRFADGAAATPSIAFTNAATTGLFRLATSILGISTAGTERVRVDGNGRVGIGAAATADRLEVHESSSVRSHVLLNDTDGSRENVLVQFAKSGTLKWAFGSGINTATAHEFGLYDYGAAALRLLVDSSGNVGIGAAPSGACKLEVIGAAATATKVAINGFTTAIGYYEAYNTSGDMIAGVEGSAGGAIATGSAAYSAVFGTGLSKSLHLFTNATVGLTLDSSGRVGIGQTSPSAVLHLKAGTASANTAPLKFAAGTLLSSVELGAMEFTDDGTTGHLYVTLNIAGVLTRKLIV